MIESRGNSNEITRRYLDSLLIETRYMNSRIPELETELFGKKVPSPVMTAALSHLDHFMFPGASKAYLEGEVRSGAVLWLGMAEEEEVEMYAQTGVTMVEVIKPYADRDLIYKKIEQATRLKMLAVGIDIDHPFSEDGGYDEVDGYPMLPMTTEELKEICAFSPLPVVAKGVLSVYDANEAIDAGAAGLLLSHHNNRIVSAIPPLMAMPKIRAHMKKQVPLFVDCEIRSGMDAFKALCLGASGVGVGRPLMTALKKDGPDGVAAYLKEVNDGLRKAMAYTGCADMSSLDETIVWGVR